MPHVLSFCDTAQSCLLNQRPKMKHIKDKNNAEKIITRRRLTSILIESDLLIADDNLVAGMLGITDDNV